MLNDSMGKERKKGSQPHSSYDSDDEKILGPPELSNFGVALLSEKEKENHVESYRRRDALDHHSQKLNRFGSSNFDSSSGSFNQQATGQTHVSVHSGEPSQSTMFAYFRSNQQPSITTMNTNDIHIADSSDLEKSFRRIKSMQQSMREELTSRHAERRSKRFLKSSRMGVLGPAKRSASNTVAGYSDLSAGNLEAGQFDTSETEPKPNNNFDSFAQAKSYRKGDEALFDREKDSNSILVDHSLSELGTLNPVQYLKKYNLPSSELPNISRIYFEKQREENHHIALQKHTISREALNSRIARSFSCTSSLNNPDRRETSAPVSNPRRKLSDTSVSSTTKTAFLKAASSPLVESSLAKSTFVEQEKSQGVPFDFQHSKPEYQHTYANQNTVKNSYKKREALANIDVNRNNQDPILGTKRFKPLENKSIPALRLSASFPQEINDDAGARKTKRVEIIEPRKSQTQLRRNFITVNDIEYEKIELLGRGGSSKVYKVKGSGNKVFALKRVVFDEFDDSSVDGFKGEIELLKKLENQKRVVKLIDYEMDHGVLFLIMECGDHDLSQILNQRSDMPLDFEFVRYYTREMLKCVKVVHESGIVHSDLKPANFVLVKGVLKIIDFGIANAVPDHTVNIYRETQIGTPNYMAPEALVAMNYTQSDERKKQQNRWKVGKPSDIWSCGCIVYQMVYGRPPYGGFQGQNRLLAIMNPEVKIVFSDKISNGQLIPRSALDLMKACLSRNPEKRWTVDEALECSFLKPVMVTPFFIRDLIKNAVKYGSDQKEVSDEKVNELADDVLTRLEDFRL
ncbi:hypothetical protein HG535_0C02750 [Zygotorulaspora mrakii]|uniref:Protein kinase domain-containing protein n=1 Tax=Zygotorulaspora mrakii TaxID=42260 RepID=A0A7H9B0A1_ZYGMR|nr:uncharacterized protein HG535_0C02750 [Zygotorulaspora mrakii]QLG71923.1 hypothetical protein HG535_0C02750 [Zygotorulaspora mrakii]